MWGKKISMILSIVTDFSHGNVNNFKTCFSLAFMKLCIRLLDHYLCQSVFDKIRLRIEGERERLHTRFSVLMGLAFHL